MLAIIGLVVALASIVEVDSTTYKAEVTDAGFLKTGDEVRVAGIKVGTVSDLVLHGDHVSVRFTVDDHVHVGDASTLSVRMLTVVGGYYLAVLPMGTEPLGESTIPASRVQLPYSLPALFQDAADPIADIDGNPMREALAEIRQSSGGRPDSIRHAVGAVESIVNILDRQNRDISRTLAVSDEYIRTLNDTKSVLRQFITSSNILEDLAEQSLTQVGKALGTVARLLARLTPVSEHWRSTFLPMARSLSDSIPPLQQLHGELTALLEAVTTLGDSLRPLGEGVPKICVPTQDRPC
ncbi:MlaD family protein [Gordonia sp. LSe1-13]|uniref:MlaD family protein n=1 Tax=Gordonia sesuvii TaxID=3116777 RepID=A0ABU7M9Y4_9ACTN|nr:MlaD family protein [Gordonia sp. LSe1-13]